VILNLYGMCVYNRNGSVHLGSDRVLHAQIIEEGKYFCLDRLVSLVGESLDRWVV
jgi:hypothetical protein